MLHSPVSEKYGLMSLFCTIMFVFYNISAGSVCKDVHFYGLISVLCRERFSNLYRTAIDPMER